jgi:xylose dehydrogenase (NAD/NADP)
MPVRWGILSTARINDWVLDATRDSTAVEFVAVGGRSPRRTRSWAAERGIERAHGSYDELLADPEVDAVYVSLPNSLHAEWALAALRAGKHVLCEKPLGRDPVAVGAAAALAEEKGLVLAEAFMYRYHPQTARVEELLAAGRIGRLRHVAATLSFAMGGGVAADPRLAPEMEGGALMDVGCYCVSAARLYAGEPESVHADYLDDGTAVDLRTIGTLWMADGVTAQFDCAMTLPRRDRLELVGDEGTLTLADPWHCRTPAIELRRPPTLAYGPPEPGDGVESVPIDPDGSLGLTGRLADAYRCEIEAISAAIVAGTGPRFGGADAVAQARALAALDRSAHAGERVFLASDEEEMK